MKNKNILVFGSTGFIGRSLTKRLLQNGDKLICPVRNASRVKRNVLSGDIGQIEVMEFNIHNLDEIKSSDLKLGVTLTKRNQELIDILPSKQMEYYKVNRDTNPATNRRISKSQCSFCSEIETISIQDWIGII